MRGTAASHRDPGKSDAQEDGASIQKGKGEVSYSIQVGKEKIDSPTPTQTPRKTTG